MIAMYPHTQNIHCIYASFVVAVDGYTWEKEPCNVYILLAQFADKLANSGANRVVMMGRVQTRMSFAILRATNVYTYCMQLIIGAFMTMH